MKRRLLAQTYGSARQEITRLAGSAEQRRMLGALATEALGAAGEGGTVETGEQQGSVVARSHDGRTRIDNSLLSRLERAQGREEAEVARLLFGARDAAARGRG
jgi:vacuolar-type H+-ATPase subunit E/Vma4